MITFVSGNLRLSRIHHLKVLTAYTRTGITPLAIAFDGTNMWTANYGGDSVTKILVITQ